MTILGGTMFVKMLNKVMYKVLLVVCFLCCLMACENDLAEIDRLITNDQVKVETAYDVQLLYSDSAVVQVRISGPRMLRHLNKSTPFEEFPDGVRVEFLTSGKEARSELTAKYAVRYENKNEVIARDSVVWKSGKGEELITNELIWDDKKKRVHTSKFVKIIKPDEVFYGYGFEADQDFNKWTIIQPAGEMKVEGLEKE